MDHIAILEKLCRVCGRSVVTKSVTTKYNCEDHLDALHTVFGVAARLDNPLSHPKYFCHACKTVMYKATTRKQPLQHLTIPFVGWCVHVDSSCGVCEHYSSIWHRGRPKKTSRTPGRPPMATSSRYCIEHIHGIAPPPLTPHNEEVKICSIHQSAPITELYCSLCRNILCSPVELVKCGKIVCADCLSSKLQQTLECPCCHTDHLHLHDFSTEIRKAPPLVVSMLGSVCVVCEKCTSHIQLKEYREHSGTGNSCKPVDHEVQGYSKVNDLLQQPITAPLTPIEQKIQTSLARRSLSTSSSEAILQMKTGGKVYEKLNQNIIKYIPTYIATDICSSEAGASTHWRGIP